MAAVCDHNERLGLQELLNVAQLSCPKSILRQTSHNLQTIHDCGNLTIEKRGIVTIDKCAMLDNLKLLKCQNVKDVCLSDCPELQELSSLARLSCLKRITIHSCDKIQTIKGY